MQNNLETIISEIPWDFDRYDERSFCAHWNKLASLREAALEAPLQPGLEFTVTLECPSIERDRPILSRARTTDPCRLVLRTPLQTEVDCWSQVWIVSVHSSSALNPESHSETAEELAVVKIIQPSMLRIPHPDYEIYECIPPRRLAVREHLVYRQLEGAQGSSVPYYYGMTQVRT